MKNLFVKTLAIVAFVIVAAVQTMAQESFAYQAVIRNAEGELIANQDVNVKFSLSNGGKTYYTETQQAKTNQYGNISVEVGKGKAEKGVMSDVPWETLDITLKVEVEFAGDSKFITLGETKINPAPYALYAPAAGGAAVVNGASKDNGNLFEVTDRDGNPVFAVTNEGIVVYVDDSSDDKARRSGFIVTGRTATKNGDGDLFAVTAEGTKVYVDDPDSQNDKARRSGFIVTGRTATKNSDGDLFAVNDEGTKVYVEGTEADKTRRSGFVVTGRTATKDADTDIFAVDAATTTVYVDDPSSQGDKTRRSGFIVTGRTATKDSKIIDINGSRTNLTTATLSIANAQASEEDAPVSALHISEENVTMNSSMAMEGGVRPVLDVEEIEKIEEYNYWLSDSRTDEVPDGYDNTYPLVDFEFRNQTNYSWLGAFHDDMVVPLSSKGSMLMFNHDGKETAIAEDAIAVVYFDESENIKVWPLAALHDFTVSFALTDYTQTSLYGGSADEYARFNVTLNSKKPYAGCRVNLDGDIAYTAKITTPDRSFEQHVIQDNGYSNAGFNAVLGQKITLEATDIPEDKFLGYWIVNGRRYKEVNPITLTVSSLYTSIEAVMEDKSAEIWVDGTDTPMEDHDRDGSKEYPYKTIAEACAAVAGNEYSQKGFRIIASNIEGSIEVSQNCDNHAQYITIDFKNSNIAQIIDNTMVPVYVRNIEIDPVSDYGDGVIVANGAKLTLEQCYINGNDAGNQHGISVTNGELVLIGGTVDNFSSASAAYVNGDNATLTLKGRTTFGYNGGSNSKTGSCVYLSAGSTLNAIDCSFDGNEGYDDYEPYPGYYGHNEGYAGVGVYVEAGAHLNVYANAYIEGVGLAKGAKVTAMGNFTVERKDDGYVDEPIDICPVVMFDTIADPTQKIVELGTGTDASHAGEICGRFVIDNQSLIETGYLRGIGSDGKPVKSNKVYSWGSISLRWSNVTVPVSYKYYRSEEGNEYLHLKYQHNATYEYHNYWLVGNTIYRDTICVEYHEDVLPIYDCIENFSEIFDECDFNKVSDLIENYAADRPEGSLLAIDTAALRSNLNVVPSETEAGVYTYNDKENNKPVLSTKNDIVISMQLLGIDTFRNKMIALKNILDSSICVAGMQHNIADMVGFAWTEGMILFGESVQEVEGPEANTCTYTLEEIEERLGKLRDGFDVAISSLGGTVVAKIGNNDEQTIVGFDTLKVGFNQTLTLTANCYDGTEFVKWSDNVKEATRTDIVRGDMDIYPIFKYGENDLHKTFFYVSGSASAKGNGSSDAFGSEGNPFNSVNTAALAIERGGEPQNNVIITVSGEVKGPQTLGSNIIANSVSIMGNGKNDELAILNGNREGTTLKVTTNSPVIISDIIITGGYAENGGGIYIGTEATVSLDNMTFVRGNACYESGCGGGVYNAGKLFMYMRAVIGDDNATKAASSSVKCSNTAWRGAGLYNEAQASAYLGYLNADYPFELTGGIYYNYIPGGLYSEGAGIYNNGTLKMNTGNVAFNGSGQYYGSGYGYGAGISTSGSSSSFEMTGGAIRDNKCNESSSPYTALFGGGVRVGDNSTFTMSDGEISNNEADCGGGVSIASSTFRMSGGVIKGNKSRKNEGSGVIFEDNSFYISDSAVIAADNDVYLVNQAKIQIAGPLSNDNVATITPGIYDFDTQVLGDESDDALVAAVNSKFAVTPYGENNYAVGCDGILKVLYRINEPEDLKSLFSQMNSGTISSENIYISIENNLELTNHVPFEFEEKINDTDWKTVGFKGVFDGNGHTITINSFDNSYTWGNSKKNVNTLVCYENEGIIQNVIVKGEIENKLEFLTGHVDAGGLCYCNAGGIVRNCWNDMSFDVSILHQTGGICAINKGLIENCINTGTIKAEFNDSNWENVYGLAGGICGENMSSDPGVHAEGVIKNCVNYGQVEISTTNNYALALNGAGGAICASNGQESSKQGATYPTIEYCYWLENCVKTGNAGTGLVTTNYMVYNDSRVRFGTASHCNYIDSRNDGIAVRPGSVELCGNEQNYQDGPNLDENLNTYVDNTNNGVLKHWVKIQEGSNYIVVLNFND